MSNITFKDYTYNKFDDYITEHKIDSLTSIQVFDHAYNIENIKYKLNNNSNSDNILTCTDIESVLKSINTLLLYQIDILSNFTKIDSNFDDNQQNTILHNYTYHHYYPNKYIKIILSIILIHKNNYYVSSMLKLLHKYIKIANNKNNIILTLLESLIRFYGISDTSYESALKIINTKIKNNDIYIDINEIDPLEEIKQFVVIDKYVNIFKMYEYEPEQFDIKLGLFLNILLNFNNNHANLVNNIFANINYTLPNINIIESHINVMLPLIVSIHIQSHISYNLITHNNIYGDSYYCNIIDKYICKFKLYNEYYFNILYSFFDTAHNTDFFINKMQILYNRKNILISNHANINHATEKEKANYINTIINSFQVINYKYLKKLFILNHVINNFSFYINKYNYTPDNNLIKWLSDINIENKTLL